MKKQNSLKIEPSKKFEHPDSQVVQLDRRLFNFSSLLQAIKALDNILQAEELYYVFASIVREKFGLKSLALFIMDEKDENFQLVQEFGLTGSVPAGFSFPRSEGLLWRAILQGRPFSTMDGLGQPRFNVPFQKHRLDLLQSKLFVPLVHKSRVVGVLGLGEKGHAEEYTDEDLDFLTILAEHAAVSINTTTLYEKNQKDKVELDKMVRNLSILYNIGRAMTYIRDLKNLLKFILAQAVETTEAQKGSLMLYDPQIKRLVVRVVKGLPDPKVEEAINSGEMTCATFAIGEGIAGKVFKTLKPMIVNSTENDDRYEARKSSNVDSILCLPLIASEEPIGVINITNKVGGKGFTNQDLELLTALSNQAAISINTTSLYEMAITDELTKIYIRRYFNIQLEKELKRAKRYGHPVSLAICDLDHFKAVNDTYGHQVGDEVLVAVAGILRASSRDIDTPARFGGEEFAVILPETGLEGARVMAERIRLAVADAKIPSLPTSVTISIGVACYPEHADEFNSLIQTADEALYDAKHQGRNRVCACQKNIRKKKNSHKG